jgi:hypothetical protein
MSSPRFGDTKPCPVCGGTREYRKFDPEIVTMAGPVRENQQGGIREFYNTEAKRSGWYGFECEHDDLGQSGQAFQTE